MAEAGLDVQTTKDYRYSYEPAKLKLSNLESTAQAIRAKIAPFRFLLAARNISRELKLEGKERILEIGSGLGLLGKAIKKEVEGEVEYYGLELAYNPAARSKENAIEPVQANAVTLPFSRDSFDVVISTDVLEHISDEREAIREIYRVLKPGGKAFLVIADPSEGRFSKVSGHIDRTKSDSDVSYWEEIFEKAGFEVLRQNSGKYRNRDWRKIFNLPFLVKLKHKPVFACAFNPVNRPGTYVLKKPSAI